MANRSEAIRNRGKDFLSTKTLYNGIYLAGMIGSIMMGVGSIKSHEEVSKANELLRTIPDKLVTEPKTNTDGTQTNHVILVKDPQSVEDVNALLEADNLNRKAVDWSMLTLAGVVTLMPGAIVAVKDFFDEAREDIKTN